jgi:2-isopropylmalate synthase
MQPAPITKYRPFPQVPLSHRKWPSRTLTEAPIWCSVDLRDGNQALAVPMRVEEKLEYFEMLVRLGFREIEVGFPSASQIEFDFCRRLIEEKRIPKGVTIQVLTQAREELIRRTFEAIQGAECAIVHLYNSTSPIQRTHVFGLAKPEIVKIAVNGTRLCKELAAEAEKRGTKVRFEYSPESFTSTELEFALEICEAVVDVWQPTPTEKIILNLPATVEYATPNVHADQIEWMCTHLKRRDCCLISLHTHNDRGTAIAATELGLLAGADRVEGTLFGNGERTGNLDIVTVALNLYTQGIHPGLDFSDLPAIRATYERLCGMQVPERQPYAGDLVFTAFSGSHQDAIRKTMAAQKENAPWEVLYIPIDPKDIGRTYQAIIRINSQSGKGGVAYILEKEFGYALPKAMHPEVGRVVQVIAEDRKVELPPEQILAAFTAEFVDRVTPARLEWFQAFPDENQVGCECHVSVDGVLHKSKGHGNGPIDALAAALHTIPGMPRFQVTAYAQHALGAGADSKAVSYLQIKSDGGFTGFGCGTDTNIEIASVKAMITALNRALTHLGRNTRVWPPV